MLSLLMVYVAVTGRKRTLFQKFILEKIAIKVQRFLSVLYSAAISIQHLLYMQAVMKVPCNN